MPKTEATYSGNQKWLDWAVSGYKQYGIPGIGLLVAGFVFWNRRRIEKLPAIGWVAKSIGNLLEPDTSLAQAKPERLVSQDDVMRAIYEKALRFYQKVNDRLGQASVQHDLGDLERTLGNHDAARKALTAAADLYQAEGMASKRQSILNILRELPA